MDPIHPHMGQVKGIGGVFVRSKDPDATRKWYEEMLGLEFDETNATVIMDDKKGVDAYSVFSLMPEDTDYMDPSKESYMINFRVEGVKDLVEELRGKGVVILMEPQVYQQGTFASILDPEGRKIELYELPD